MLAKDRMDEILDKCRMLSSVGEHVVLSLDAWLYRWLYDRALACGASGRQALLLSPPPDRSSADAEEALVSGRTLRALLDVKGEAS